MSRNKVSICWNVHRTSDSSVPKGFPFRLHSENVEAILDSSGAWDPVFITLPMSTVLCGMLAVWGRLDRHFDRFATFYTFVNKRERSLSSGKAHSLGWFRQNFITQALNNEFTLWEHTQQTDYVFYYTIRKTEFCVGYTEQTADTRKK
jgi:hypothetical protein